MAEYGSARKLDGLTGEVCGVHPIAAGWVIIRLDPNHVTEYRLWPISADRLVLLD